MKERREIVCTYGSEAALMAELYREVGAIRKLKHAPTILDLRAEFKRLAQAARDAGDVELLARLVEAKDARKAALEGKNERS